MKRYLLIVLLGTFLFSAKAQSITDFCYYDGELLETYSDSEIVSHLRARGFKLVKKSPFYMEGAGGAMTKFNNYTLKKGNTTIIVGNGPDYVKFGSVATARNFLNGAVNTGWFRKRGNYYEPIPIVAFGIDGMRLSGSKVVFSLSVP